jgi:predicted ATPase
MIGHPYTLFVALFTALNIDLLTGELGDIEQHTDLVEELLKDRRLSKMASGVNQGFRGWSLAERGLLEPGLDLLREAQAKWRSFYGAWCYPLDASLAILLGKSGHSEEGFRIVDDSLEAARKRSSHWWDAEFYRIRAGLHLAGGSTKRRAAEVDLERALADARARHARLFELRATHDLARVRAEAGERESACDLLTPICAWFTQSSETRSLKQARALLDTLA